MMADDRKIFVHNFTLKITSARARIRARLNKGPVVSLVEKIWARATKRANILIFLFIDHAKSCYIHLH